MQNGGRCPFLIAYNIKCLCSFRSTNYQLKNKLNMETKISNEVENGNLQQGAVRSSFNYEAAWKLLEEKGLNVGERMKIRKAFSDWGKKFDENIEHDHKHNTYSSKKKKGYGFSKEEEVKFFNALLDFSPNSDTEKIIQVMSIVMKLLDVESEWSFRGSR